MQTDEGLDTGPILAQARCAIEAQDTRESLTGRLARMGAELLIDALPRWLSGALAPRPQPEQGVTLAPRLTKQDGRIDWSRPATYIERMTRAYAPWPSAYTTFRGQLFKVVRARALPDWPGTGLPGEVKTLPQGDIAVVTGQGALVLLEVQMAGKQAMPCEAFVCGYQDFEDSILGERV
jgi:methionyl-tRNA formyltransferase